MNYRDTLLNQYFEENMDLFEDEDMTALDEASFAGLTKDESDLYVQLKNKSNRLSPAEANKLAALEKKTVDIANNKKEAKQFDKASTGNYYTSGAGTVGKGSADVKDNKVKYEAAKKGRMAAMKDFAAKNKKGLGIGGGAAIGAAGAGVAASSAVKLAKLKKNAKELYTAYRAKGGKDSYEVWYKKKKASLIGGIAGGAAATAAGATGAAVAKKKLQETAEIAFIEGYYNELQALEEAFNSTEE